MGQKIMGDMKGPDQVVEKGSSSGSGSKKKYIIIGIVAAVIILALVGVIIFLLMKKDKPADAAAPEDGKREVLVTEENVQDVVEQMEQQENVPQGYYTVTQNYEWHFPKGNAESSDAHVENLPENTNDVYFDLFLADNDQEPIYQSPVIPLGAVLENFKLDKKLSKGTYDCIMVYHLVDKDQNSISTVSMKVKVIIEN
ncbi:MAG: hypothetical protein IK111_08305 [Lachnospiraceae bacterium]|nr:hypothetical protein [Lachnospiraceae bacterium]